MKVVQVVPRISDEASGPSYAVPALCQALAGSGVEVELHVTEGDTPPGAEYRVFAHGEWPRLRRLGVSPTLRRALAGAARRADLMHNHSLWLMANVYPAVVTPGSGCLLMTSPHGTLSSWALRRSYWPKRVMWWLCQARTLRRSACLHATVEAEYVDIRRAGLSAPVAVIPHGVDLPPDASPDESPGDRPLGRRLLFLGRIHPTKGVDVLLRAWRRVQDRAPDWRLQVVGQGEAGYPERMRRLADELGVERVEFPGPVFGPAKTVAYRRADLFVLPTHSENFGMTVAEALAHGVPAIVSRGAPWQGLEAHRCGWWIELGVEPLVECLRQTLRLDPQELAERGARGRDWMRRDFSWSQIGEMMHETYRWLLAGGTPPFWVRTVS